MKTQRPAVIYIAAVLLIILTLMVGGFGLARRYGLLQGTAFSGRNGLRSGFPGRGTFPQGGFPNGGFNNSQNGQTPNFNSANPNRAVMVRLLRLFNTISTVVNIGAIVLAVIAAIGLFMKKRWGAVLGIILAVILLLLGIPGILRSFSTLAFVESTVRIVLAIAVIVLLLLPQARKAYR
jgi:hypothetical protein